jgi:hypothetical protein
MRNASGYSEHFIPNMKYKNEKIQLLGNTARINGFIDDDYNSNDSLLNEVESKNPNAIILGNHSYTDMEYLRRGNFKFMTRPKLESVKVEQTLAKKQFAKFFTDEIEQTTRYFSEMDEEANDYTIFETDRMLKRKMARPELSIAKYACSTHNKKLFFGKPNPLILIEDLAYRLTLQELQDIFDDCLQTYHQMSEEIKVVPAEHPIDIHYNIR